MPTFEEALKANLFGLNEGFQTADSELHQEVAAAARVVEAISGGAARLRLVPFSESPEGITYSLQLLGSGETQATTLFRLTVASRGYPIKATAATQTGETTIVLNKRQEIANLLSEMASNPDSVLVQFMAYLMRSRRK